MKTTDVQEPAFFDAQDLAACQSVFDELLKEMGLAKESDEAGRIAAIVIDLYQQGVHDPPHLKVMVENARSLFGSYNPMAAPNK